jgi:hypothetical protein
VPLSSSAARKQFFVEAANLSGAVHKVTLLTFCVEARILFGLSE